MVISASFIDIEIVRRASMIFPISHSDSRDGVPPPMYTCPHRDITSRSDRILISRIKACGILRQAPCCRCTQRTENHSICTSSHKTGYEDITQVYLLSSYFNTAVNASCGTSTCRTDAFAFSLPSASPAAFSFSIYLLRSTWLLRPSCMLAPSLWL